MRRPPLISSTVSAILASSAGLRNEVDRTSVPISGRSVIAASAEMSDQHSHMPRGSSPGTRWMRWSVIQRESAPICSPSWAISRRSLQRAEPPFIWRSVSGRINPTFNGRPFVDSDCAPTDTPLSSVIGSERETRPVHYREKQPAGNRFHLPSHNSAVSSQIVTGPSLTSSTCISAPKRPVATGRPSARKSVRETIDQWLGDGGRRRLHEAGTASLAAIGVEGELRHDQHPDRLSGFQQIERRAVEIAVRIVEDTEICHFARQEIRRGGSVVERDPHQENEPRPDLPAGLPRDRHPGPGHALRQNAHPLALRVARSRNEGRRRQGGDPLAAADRAHPLVRRRFYADSTRRQTEAGGDALPHQGHVRPDARRFREEGGVDVPGNPARLSCQAGDLAQQMLAVGVSEALVGGREVLADVAERRRAEDRVGDGVQQHIGVGMPFQPPIVRDLDAAEDQAASRREAMSVVADADPRRDRRALR